MRLKMALKWVVLAVSAPYEILKSKCQNLSFFGHFLRGQNGVK
jgi:hypothetical protein